MSNLKLKFYGGVESVTGANFMLQSEKSKILVDCGIQQGGGYNKCENDPNRKDFQYNPAEADVLLITHAHADHIGRIPKLVKDGFRGKIYSTPSTLEISRVMFKDSLKILAEEARKCRMSPLYTQKDVGLALALWETIPYHQNKKIRDDFEVELKDAGHVLGSAIVELNHMPNNKKIIFTGDLGNSSPPLIKKTENISGADYLIMESVYGDRNHEGRSDRKEKLKEVIKKVIKRKGTLLIPVFSLEKTQVLLLEMNDLIEGGEVPSVPVFFDSPLGLELTEIYSRKKDNFNEKIQDQIDTGDDIFDFPKLVETPRKTDTAKIHRTKPPKIIIASSGMSVGGRIIEHEMKYLKNPQNAILFIGYQVSGSLGRDILEKKPFVRIYNKKIPLKAEVEVVGGYSSHMDSDHLVEFVSNTKDTVKKVFIVMGEKKSANFLADRLKNELEVLAVCPKEGDEVKLI